MDLWTVDFETYWADDYTLSKMTTEEYVRDPRFETILCSFQKNEEESYWVDGPDVAKHLRKIDLSQCAVLAHHAHFDGLILNHHYNVRPKRWYDTLSMARGLHGAKGGLKLGELAKKYGIQDKGEEVFLAKNMRRSDFSERQLERYGNYCCNDSDIAYQLFLRMLKRYPATELQLIDRRVRMFAEPQFVANVSLLREYIKLMKVQKAELLLEAGVAKDEVMSNEKFARCLMELGIEPPLKISPSSGKIDKKTGQKKPMKWIYAFAKTDAAMQDLAEHVDERVQVLVAARLKNKSTIDETRAERMLGMMERGGNLPIYIKYAGADQTMRDSGGDKTNWQNNKRGGVLRNALLAPKGKVCAVADSRNIEARMLDWAAGQNDMVKVYRLNDMDSKKYPDVYCVMAEKIYNKLVTKADTDERQMGKVTKLGLGFGMGATKFPFAVRAQAKDADGRPLVISDAFAHRVVNIYRESHFKVQELWDRAREALWMIIKGKYNHPVDPKGIILTAKEGLWLPNGMKIRYTGLKWDTDAFDESKKSFTYWNGRSVERIYGAKVVENIVQALARILVMEQCLMVPRRMSWALPVHDEGVWLIPDEENAKQEWIEAVSEAFRTPLDWCETLPINLSYGIHRSYGKVDK